MYFRNGTPGVDGTACRAHTLNFDFTVYSYFIHDSLNFIFFPPMFKQ